MEPPRCDAGHGRRDAAPVITSERGSSRIPPPVTQGVCLVGKRAGDPLRPRLVRPSGTSPVQVELDGPVGSGHATPSMPTLPAGLTLEIVWELARTRGGQRLPVQSDRCDWRPLLIGNISICPSRQGGSTSGPLIATNRRPAAADHRWKVTRAGRMGLVMLLKRRTGTSAVSTDTSGRPTSSR